jgi:hypothetical protein
MLPSGTAPTLCVSKQAGLELMPTRSTTVAPFFRAMPRPVLPKPVNPVSSAAWDPPP